MKQNALLDPTRAPQTAASLDSTPILRDLTGRRIALVNNAWPSWHTMADRLAELLAARYDGVTFARYTIPNGSAAAPELLRRIAAEADAAVVGLANCGSCTAWAYHDSMELVRQGLPSVLMVTKEFGGLADTLVTARRCDVPRVLLPLNPETVERAEAVGLVDDAVDDITGRLLTAQATGATPAPAPAATPRLVEVDTDDDDDEAAQELFYQRGWTDGLPIRLPTQARVDRLLDALGDVDPAAVIANMPPTGFGVTYEALAVNAVMAGATADLMPILVAVVRAACEPRFNLNGIATTTGPSTPMIIVNGPVAEATGVNSGRGALGHGVRANVTLGRTLRLLINNIGGAKPGPVSKSIMGQPGRLSFCFAERAADSPWAPLHADRGLDPVSGAVTVMGATGSMNVLTPRQDVDAMLTLLAEGLAFMGNPNVVMGRGTVGVLITPGHARAMAGAGLSKADVATEIWKRAWVPLDGFAPSALAEPPYELTEHDGRVYAAQDPEHIFVIVVGGPEPTHATLVPSHPSSVPVTRAITPVGSSDEG